MNVRRFRCKSLNHRRINMAQQQVNPESLQQLMGMGFSQQQAADALRRFANPEHALNFLLTEQTQQADPQSEGMDDQTRKAIQESIQEQSKKEQVQGLNTVSNEDVDVAKAIEQSLSEKQSTQYEPFNPEQRRREEGQPCGLKNIGNTCWFNSLLQVYYSIPSVVTTILEYKDIGELKQAIAKKNESADKAQDGQQEVNPQIIQRVKASQGLLLELQTLFAFLSRSDKKYSDPTAVLKSVVDDFGNPIEIGDQKDIGEFNQTFLARIQEGLHSNQIFQKYQEEEKQQEESQMQLDQTEKSIKDQEMVNTSSIGIEESKDQDVEMNDENVKPLKKSMSQMSPVKSQAQEVEEKGGIISQTFLGQLTSLLEYKDKNNDVKVQEIKEVFSEVMLNVIGINNLYEAWESMCYNYVEDYKTPEGEKTQALKVDWISKLPKVFCMQMNRLKYQAGEAVKVNSTMKIEQTIYADRFMIENKQQSEALRQKVNDLRDKIKQLESCIKKYKDFDGSQYDLHKVLSLASQFFQKQGSEQDQHNPTADVKQFLPLNQDPPVNKKEQSQLVTMLEKYASNVSDQVTTMEKQVEDLNQQVEKTYSSMNKHPYYLHAICIHDGSAQSGHYYAFIYDRFQKKWRRFNDVKVTDVEEDEVFRESNGGHGNMNAYWVVYVNEETAAEMQKVNINTYRPSETPVLEKNHPYISRLSGPLNMLVDEDNLKFKEEIVDWQSTQLVKQIQKKYDEMYAEFQQGIESLLKQPTLKIANIITYLYLEKEENILRKVLLDLCFKEVQQISLSLLDQEDPIIRKLKQMVISKSPKYPRDGPHLNQGEQLKLDRYLREFKAMRIDATITNEILATLNQDDLVNATAIIQFNYKRVGFGSDNMYMKVPRDALRVAILYMTSKINKLLTQKNEDKELYVKLLLTVHHALNMLEKTDHHRIQAVQNLKETLNYAQPVLERMEMIKDFTLILNAIEEGKDIDQQELNAAKDFELELKSEFKQRINDLMQMQDWVYWTPLLDDTQLHFQYNTNLEKFKSQFDTWKTFHFELIKKKAVLSPDYVYQKEKEIGIDIRSLANQQQ